MELKKRGRGRPRKEEKAPVANMTEGAKVCGSVDRRKRGRPRKDEKTAIANVTEGAKVCGTIERRDKRFVGGYVRKMFPGYGAFLGKVISFTAGLYKVLYEDGDSEEVHYDELCRISVDKSEFDADTLNRKNKLDQLVYSGKLVPETVSTRAKRKASITDRNLGDASSRSGLSSEPESLVADRVEEIVADGRPNMFNTKHKPQKSNFPVVDQVEEIVSDDGRTDSCNRKHKRQKVLIKQPSPLVADKATLSEIEPNSKGSVHLETDSQMPLGEMASIPSPRGPLIEDGRPTLLDGSTEQCLDREAESFSDSCESDDHVEGHESPGHSKNILPPPLLPPSSSDIDVPLEAVGNLFSVYNFLRSFSHQLFLSPFSFEEFVASLICSSANSILDAVHVSLLRALKRHLESLSSDGDVLASRILRHLDWSFVDAFTWPAYVVEYVLVSGVISKTSLKAGTNHLGEYDSLPVFTKLRILQILCDDVIASAELRAELDMREKKSMSADADIDPSFPVENKLGSAYSDRLKNYVMCPPSSKNLSQPALNPSSNSNLGSKADLQVVDEETAKDGNSDECCLCSMDGMLVCCDGCPSAYHSRCVGINKAFLPDGSWFCPECVVNKTGSVSSRIGRGLCGAEIFGVDPYGRAFFGTCNYLLVLEDLSNQEATCRYYNAFDIPAVLRALCSSEHSLTTYSDICKGIVQYWGILHEAKALKMTNSSPNSVITASLNSITLDQSEGVNGTQMFLTDATENGSVCHKIEANSCPSDAELSYKACGKLPDHQDVNDVNGDYGSLALQNTEHLDLKKCNVGVYERPAGCPEALRVDICETFGNSSMGNGHADCATKEYENLNNDPATAVSVHLPVGDASQQVKQHLCGRSTTTESASCVSASRTQPTGANEEEANTQVVTIGGIYQKVEFIPYAYTNQYILGDIAASAAANLSIMAAEEKKISSSSNSSNPKHLASANISLQMKAFSGVASHFFWPSFEKKPLEIPRERCGWCATCKSNINNSNNRKGCLLNAAASSSVRGTGRSFGSGPRAAKNSMGHIGAIGLYILHIEECLRGLMCDSWVISNQRSQWRKQVEQASTCRELKILLLMFEENIRLVAFYGAWIKQADDWLSEVSTSEKCVVPVRQTQKLGPGRKNQKVSGNSVGIPDSAEPGSNDFVWWRGGKLSKEVFNIGMLPSVSLNKAARQGGSRRIPGIFYSENSENPRRSRCVAWRAAVEVVKSTCHLALQVRYLDAHIRWNELYRPEQVSQDMRGTHLDHSAFRNADLRKKFVENNETRYMLDFGIQKDIPARVMKNVIRTDQDHDGKSKFWFSENHIPLYLIKEYEEKISLTCSKQSMLHKKSALHQPGRHSIAFHKDIFSYLIQKLDMPERFSCGRCQNDMSPKFSVKCIFCQEPAFTCYTCYSTKQDEHRNGGRDYFMNSKVEGQTNGLTTPYYRETGAYLYPYAPSSLESVEAHQPIPGTPKPCQNILKKRGDGTDFGLILRKNKAFECSTDFWSKNVLGGRNQLVDGSLKPECIVCGKPYNPDLLYVKCEYCGRWFHGDAVNLVEDQADDVVGFKCCRCRKKCMPECPYADPNRKKSIRNKKRKQSSGVHHIDPQQPEMVPSISFYENLITFDSSEAEDDPFLFSLEKVEAVLEEQSMTEIGSIWGNTESIYGVPKKLPVRRCRIKEKGGNVDDCHIVLDEHQGLETESTPQSEWQLSSAGHCENGEAVSSLNDRLIGSETANLDDAQYEPQTYFSFTELMDDVMETCINDDEVSLPDISFDSSFALTECGICACSDPVPDVSCAKCGYFVHGTCLPFSVENGWMCGSCES